MANYIFKIFNIEKYKTLINKISKTSHAVILQSKDYLLIDAIAKLVVMKNECLEKDKPCFICPNCQKILDGNALDVEIFGSQKNILVEDSQKIVEDSNVLPVQFSKKYFVLYDFENATVQAQNKLLKIIEEPRSFDKYIILTKNADSVLQTVKSRCEFYTLPRLESEELLSVIDYGIGEGKKINFAVQYADGNLTTLQNIMSNQTFAEIYALCRNLLINMQNSSMVLEMSTKISKYKDDIDMFFDILSVLYRDIVAIKLNKQNLAQNQEILNELLVLSNGISIEACIKILQQIQNSKQALKYNANFSGVIDNLLLKILEIKYLCK